MRPEAHRTGVSDHSPRRGQRFGALCGTVTTEPTGALVFPDASVAVQLVAYVRSPEDPLRSDRSLSVNWPLEGGQV